MTNDEILNRWYEATRFYARSAFADRRRALFAKMAAEQIAIDRFGPELHVRAYRMRFGEDPNG